MPVGCTGLNEVRAASADSNTASAHPQIARSLQWRLKGNRSSAEQGVHFDKRTIITLVVYKQIIVSSIGEAGQLLLLWYMNRLVLRAISQAHQCIIHVVLYIYRHRLVDRW